MSWWQSESGQRAIAEFKGEKWTSTLDASIRFNLNYIERVGGEGYRPGVVYTGYNSGYQAVQLALQWGAKEIILLGFTMNHVGGKKHWHDDHKGNNPTVNCFLKWAMVFNRLPRFVDASMIKIYGESAITVFEKVDEL